MTERIPDWCGCGREVDRPALATDTQGLVVYLNPNDCPHDRAGRLPDNPPPAEWNIRHVGRGRDVLEGFTDPDTACTYAGQLGDYWAWDTGRADPDVSDHIDSVDRRNGYEGDDRPWTIGQAW